MFNNSKSRQSRFSSFFQFFKERPWSILAILVLVGGVAAGLIPRVLHPFRCDRSAEAQTAHFLAAGEAANRQIIVTGVEADVTAAVPDNLTLIEDCDLSYLNYRSNSNTELTAEQRKTLVLRLYQADSGTTPEELQTIVSGLNNANGEVVADRNHNISISDSPDTCYLPNAGGSGGGGTPYGGPGGLDPYDVSVANNAFNDQWAFKSNGINVPVAATSGYTNTGRGVHVVVFDTAPYRITVPSLIIRRNKVALPSPMWFTTWDNPGSTMTSSHGLFVVGLIHKMAPASNIRLVRVLNDDGCGEMWLLEKSIHDYTSRMSFWTGKLNKTVFNLSLAVDPDPLTTAVFTLETTINKAVGLGAVVIAAAGNDSSNSPNPEPMRYPAAYANVIGVAASTQTGDRSCYSNTGDVAAPGGNGGQDPDNPTDPTKKCIPRADTWTRNPGKCTDIANCEFGVVSLVETRYGSRYALWSGTSFAAPYVSGLAALAYEKWDQTAVGCLIREGTRPLPASWRPGAVSLPEGIVDVGNTLSTATLSACGVTP